MVRRRGRRILLILKERDEPVRGVNLYRELLKYDEGYKLFCKEHGQAFWYCDFLSLMHKYVQQGFVHKIKARNKVWYLITDKGVEQVVELPERLRLRKSQLFRKVERVVYYATIGFEHEVQRYWRHITILVGDNEALREYVVRRVHAEVAKFLVFALKAYVLYKTTGDIKLYQELVRDIRSLVKLNLALVKKHALRIAKVQRSLLKRKMQSKEAVYLSDIELLEAFNQLIDRFEELWAAAHRPQL